MLPLPLPYYPPVEPPRRELTSGHGHFQVVGLAANRLAVEAWDPPYWARHKRTTYRLLATFEPDRPGRPGWSCTGCEIKRRTPTSRGATAPPEPARQVLRTAAYAILQRAIADDAFMAEVADVAQQNARGEIVITLREAHRTLSRVEAAYRGHLAAALALTAPASAGAAPYARAQAHLDELADRCDSAWNLGDPHALPGEAEIVRLLLVPGLDELRRARLAAAGTPAHLVLLAAEADCCARVLEIHRGHAAIAAWLTQQEAERGPLGADA